MHSDTAETSCFFSRYVAAKTFTPKWYLVRVAKVQIRTAPSIECSMYTVEFFANNVNDDELCNTKSRWWPACNEYEIEALGIPKFGRHILFPPHAKSNPDKFTADSENVDLASDDVLVGPFDFTNTVSRKVQLVDLTQCSRLSDACVGRGITPPSLDTHVRQRGQAVAATSITKKRAFRAHQQRTTKNEQANDKQARQE
jgi:hypothetical protein